MVTKQKPLGFTLIEIMIVVVIIGLLAAIASPAFQKIRLNSKFSTFMNDSTAYAEAGMIYLFETGAEKIQDANTGILPNELEGYINETAWDAGTPIGGSWDWDSDYGFHGVGVIGFTITEEEAGEVDQIYDDGDADTGLIRRPEDDRIYMVLAN